jgi:hypothetical protein
MKIRISIIAFLFIFISGINGQVIPEYLTRVSEHNQQIIAYRKLLDARKIEARTGLTPSDPFVSFGYMPGNSEAIGTKKIWSVSQSFSFPTKYLLQQKLSKYNIGIAESEYNYVKLMILLDAKMTVADLIFSEKMQRVLKKRKSGYDTLLTFWSKMLEAGEATILDYNKIRMEVSSLNLEINKKEAEITMLKSKLRYMGGDDFELPGFSEYIIEAEPDPHKLITEKSAMHPAFIIPEQEYQQNLGVVKLSKSEALPEFMVGYSSEIVPGETYSGPVAGFSIPLWSNTNKVKTAIAKSEHAAALRDAELLRLKADVMMLYDQMKALSAGIAEISVILKSGDNKRYLDKALLNGEISLTTYFSDLSVTYEIEDRLLDMQNEYNKMLAKLHDHELLR